MRIWAEALTALLLAGELGAQAPAPQAATLEVRVTDDSGGVIPGAEMVLTDPSGAPRQAAADAVGRYVFSGLAAGSYKVSVSWPGFTAWESGPVAVTAAQSTVLNATLQLRATAEQVTVSADGGGGLSTEATANAGALVLTGADLDALPDDPDDLAEDLKALAGPSAGIGGPQMYIDGFSGGHLPAKESIREIRINQDPFSAEYDKVGFGRTEILTKPGSDAYHGSGFWKISNDVLNSRNPYAPMKPPYQLDELGGDMGGPLGKRASMFLDVEHRTINDNAVINATALNAALQIVPVREAVQAPGSDDNLSARVDYQLSERNTLAARFNWWRTTDQNAGVGLFSLPSTGYQSSENGYTVQLTETAVLSASAVNETRVQMSRVNTAGTSLNNSPSLIVQDAFVGGGPVTPYAAGLQDRYEFQNSTSLTRGAHTLKFGARVRGVSLTDASTRDYNGQFYFSGGSGPMLNALNQPVLDASGNFTSIAISSLERYQRTLLFGSLTPAQLHQWGGGPSQFLMAGGTPQIGLSQVDSGVYIQDDWRVRPNLSLNAGLRWEAQSNVQDWRDFAPRIGFAWAPGGKHNAKTVIRGGAGIFYDRFGENLALEALRYNGVNNRLFLVHDPTFFPNVPSMAELAASGANQIVRQVQSGLRAPMIAETALGVERQLPLKLVLSVNFVNTHGMHLFRSRNINAPDPSLGGARPYSGGDIYQYESGGLFNQNQVITNLTRRFSSGVSVFGYYTYGRAYSNTDGPNSFPMNQYNLSGEYGRAATDIRHRVVVGGSFAGPLGFRLSPFLLARSGAPVNIISGVDTNGDGLYTDRPGLVTSAGAPGAVVSPFGIFNPNPGPGAVIIPRNYGQGPAYFTLNFRLSKTFGFGGTREGAAPAAGPGGQRFNLTFSAQVRNILNYVNPGLPVGDMSSALFGQSNFLAGASGPGSMMFGDNRRVLLELKFSF